MKQRSAAQNGRQKGSTAQGDPVRSLQRALDLLEALRGGPKGVTQLAQRCELSKATVHRLLSTLKARGYVIQDEDTEQYRLGWTLVGLAGRAAFGNELIASADPIMTELAARTGETVRLAVPNGHEVTIIHQIEGTNPIRFGGPVGILLPVHCSAAGKVMLAALPDLDAERVITELGLEPRGPNAITDPAALRAELSKVRSQGYAVNDEETAPGVYAVAAPIRDARGRVCAAVLVIGPAERIRHDESLDWARLIATTGNHISARLGWNG